MAIAKRRKSATTTSRRKPGAAKKRKARVGSTASVAAGTMKIAGKNFTKSSCHTTKTAAKGRAETVRASGTRARVIKSGKTYCVYTGGKSKALSRRRAA